MVNPHAPDADFDVTEPLVRDLLQQQFPEHADLAIVQADEGWDNVTFRLGSQFAVRLPRRQAAIELLQNEQRWLSHVNRTEGIDFPVPIGHGIPSPAYPAPWSLLPWLPGVPCHSHALSDDSAFSLAECLASLNDSSATGFPTNAVRGVPLELRRSVVEERLGRLRQRNDWFEGNIASWWQHACDTTPTTDSQVIHGDLHPLNVLHHDGEITALIDWGDICQGDVATDLASFWMLFESVALRRDALQAYGASNDLIARSRGWAIVFGSVLAESGLTGDPRHAEIGFATLNRVAQEPH